MAAYAEDADLTARIVATSSVAVAARQLALDDAQSMINLSVYEDRSLRAHVFLAAHYLALGGFIPGGAAGGGPIASQSAGEISVSYAVTSFNAADSLLASTTYGRQFLEIRSTISSRPGVV